jgi:hypothetical protein
MSVNDRAYDGVPCTCTAACLEREQETGEHCSGTWGSTCGCSACGMRAAEIYADGQYDGIIFGVDDDGEEEN